MCSFLNSAKKSKATKSSCSTLTFFILSLPLSQMIHMLLKLSTLWIFSRACLYFKVFFCSQKAKKVNFKPGEMKTIFGEQFIVNSNSFQKRYLNIFRFACLSLKLYKIFPSNFHKKEKFVLSFFSNKWILTNMNWKQMPISPRHKTKRIFLEI